MSAYVVNDDTVNSVVSWLSSEQFGNGITYGRATRIIKQLGFDPKTVPVLWREGKTP